MWRSLKTKFTHYLMNLLIAADQLLNAVACGYPDETFSSRAHRKAEAGQWFWRLMRRLADRLFFWEENHCRTAYESELLRRHLPAEPGEQ